jgi:poly(glycerol-phosphate) alpha-glucosyltransferase
MLPTHYASMAAHRLSRPVVFSPHGTLKREAYASGRWKQLKKQAAWFCFQGRDMHRAACIHALTGEELKSIRAFGLRNPVCVIPNGVHLEDFTALPDRSAFDERFPATKGKRLCLSLSRLHRIKNLLNLVVAWSRIMKEHAEWHLVIAGPDGGLGQELRSLVNDLGIGWSITLAGPCYGTAKLAAFGAASLFVLPSFSEGFSATVLEAMACGLPMLLSSTCDFPESVAARAAIEVLPSAEEIERGLRLLLAMPEADRKEMGRRGQSLVRSRYQWKTIARQMRDVYAWVAGGGTPPISVDTGSC